MQMKANRMPQQLETESIPPLRKRPCNSGFERNAQGYFSGGAGGDGLEGT